MLICTLTLAFACPKTYSENVARYKGNKPTRRYGCFTVITTRTNDKQAKTHTHAQAEIFSALSSPLRLQILGLLAEGESNVTVLVEKLQAEQPNVSRHLSVLRSAGLVAVRRRGLERLYKLVSPGIHKLIESADGLIGTNGHSKP